MSTYLCTAEAWNNEIDVVKLLLDFRAIPNVHLELTPLEAIFEGHLGVIEPLVESRARPTASDCATWRIWTLEPLEQTCMISNLGSLLTVYVAAMMAPDDGVLSYLLSMVVHVMITFSCRGPVPDQVFSECAGMIPLHVVCGQDTNP